VAETWSEIEEAADEARVRMKVGVCIAVGTVSVRVGKTIPLEPKKGAKEGLNIGPVYSAIVAATMATATKIERTMMKAELLSRGNVICSEVCFDIQSRQSSQYQTNNQRFNDSRGKDRPGLQAKHPKLSPTRK